MVVDLTALVRRYHVARQQMLTGVVFSHDTGQQIALGRDHLAVFIGVFIEQGGVGLLDQTPDFLIQAAALSRWTSRSWRYSMYARANCL